MATSAQRMGGLPAAGRAAGAVGWSNAVYALGAAMLAVQAAVHLQQFASIFHAVHWIGPLFLANAAACLLAAAGLAHARTRPHAALAGIAISACALSGLVLSYGPGLLGWMEAGWRTPIAVALVSELVAVLALGTGLAGAALRPR
jgi:O-antigen/teichoic acid export membrane protein